MSHGGHDHGATGRPLAYLQGADVVYALEDGETQLGRADTNDIVSISARLEHRRDLARLSRATMLIVFTLDTVQVLTRSRSVSGVHARIVVNPARPRTGVLVDLRSLNGTFVNDVRVHGESAPLASGDVIRFGYDTDSYKFFFPEDIPPSLLGESPTGDDRASSGPATSPSKGAAAPRNEALPSSTPTPQAARNTPLLRPSSPATSVFTSASKAAKQRELSGVGTALAFGSSSHAATVVDHSRRRSVPTADVPLAATAPSQAGSRRSSDAAAAGMPSHHVRSPGSSILRTETTAPAARATSASRSHSRQHGSRYHNTAEGGRGGSRRQSRASSAPASTEPPPWRRPGRVRHGQVDDPPITVAYPQSRARSDGRDTQREIPTATGGSIAYIAVSPKQPATRSAVEQSLDFSRDSIGASAHMHGQAMRESYQSEMHGRSLNLSSPSGRSEHAAAGADYDQSPFPALHDVDNAAAPSRESAAMSGWREPRISATQRARAAAQAREAVVMLPDTPADDEQGLSYTQHARQRQQRSAGMDAALESSVSDGHLQQTFDASSEPFRPATATMHRLQDSSSTRAAARYSNKRQSDSAAATGVSITAMGPVTVHTHSPSAAAPASHAPPSSGQSASAAGADDLREQVRALTSMAQTLSAKLDERAADAERQHGREIVMAPPAEHAEPSAPVLAARTALQPASASQIVQQHAVRADVLRNAPANVRAGFVLLHRAVLGVQKRRRAAAFHVWARAATATRVTRSTAPLREQPTPAESRHSVRQMELDGIADGVGVPHTGRGDTQPPAMHAQPVSRGHMPDAFVSAVEARAMMAPGTVEHAVEAMRTSMFPISDMPAREQPAVMRSPGSALEMELQQARSRRNSGASQNSGTATTVRARCLSPPRPNWEPENFRASTVSSRAKTAAQPFETTDVLPAPGSRPLSASRSRPGSAGLSTRRMSGGHGGELLRSSAGGDALRSSRAAPTAPTVRPLSASQAEMRRSVAAVAEQEAARALAGTYVAEPPEASATRAPTGDATKQLGSVNASSNPNANEDVQALALHAILRTREEQIRRMITSADAQIVELALATQVATQRWQQPPAPPAAQQQPAQTGAPRTRPASGKSTGLRPRWQDPAVSDDPLKSPPRPASPRRFGHSTSHAHIDASQPAGYVDAPAPSAEPALRSVAPSRAMQLVADAAREEAQSYRASMPSAAHMDRLRGAPPAYAASPLLPPIAPMHMRASNSSVPQQGFQTPVRSLAGPQPAPTHTRAHAMVPRLPALPPVTSLLAAPVMHMPASALRSTSLMQEISAQRMVSRLL